MCPSLKLPAQPKAVALRIILVSRVHGAGPHEVQAGLIDPFKTVGIVWQRVFPHLPGAPQQSHMEVLETTNCRNLWSQNKPEEFLLPDLQRLFLVPKWVAQPWVQPLPAFPPSVLGVE